MKKRNALQPTHGFTLIELLVVVTIISVLIALLLPALSGARDMAKEVVCQNNVRQMSMAFRMYADDYNDFLHPIARGGNPYDNCWGPWPDWYRKYLYPNSIYSANGHPNDYPIFWCPNWEKSEVKISDPNRTWVPTSYWLSPSAFDPNSYRKSVRLSLIDPMTHLLREQGWQHKRGVAMIKLMGDLSIKFYTLADLNNPWPFPGL